MKLAIKKKQWDNRNRRRNCSVQTACNMRQAMRYQMFPAPSGDLLSASHASLCCWRVPDSWCWCRICSISSWSSRTRWSLPAPSQKHTFSPAVPWQKYGGSRSIVVSLAVFTVYPFALLLQNRSAFLHLWMGKSASSTSLGPSTELHGLTPQKSVIYSRFLVSFILPCPTRRPRDYK